MKNLGLAILFFLMIQGVVAFGIKKGIQRLPAGPYLQTCRKCYIIAGKLHCECHEHAEEWNSENLTNARGCRYSIVNDHGNLTCLPYGPYLNSCARCWMVGDTLYCLACKNARGQTVQLLQRFSLPYVSECRYDIVNNNARLSCLPYGPYLRHCNNCYVHDGVLHCQCSLTSHSKGTPASLDLKECEGGTIVYQGGRLECIK